jgi:hypothetical protein
MEPYTQHETTLIPIKTAHVDKEIVELINWFNSLPSTQTIFCCQGNDVEPRHPAAAHCYGYVSFVTTDISEMALILKTINDANGSINKDLPPEEPHEYPITVEVDFYTIQCPIRFSMRGSKKALLHLQKCVGSNGKL